MFTSAAAILRTLFTPDRSALNWADINRFLVHQLVPELNTTRTWISDGPVTSVNFTEDADVLLLVFASRIGLWSPRTHPKIEAIYHLDAATGMRFNDAGVDPAGALWVVTMANNAGLAGEEVEADFKGGRALPDRSARRGGALEAASVFPIQSPGARMGRSSNSATQ